MKKFTLCIFILCALFVLAACGGKETASSQTEPSTKSNRYEQDLREDITSPGSEAPSEFQEPSDAAPTVTTAPVCTHQFTQWTVVTESTCTAEGSRTRSCTECDLAETEVIPMKEHTQVITKGVPATCTSEGTTDHIQCAVCQTVLQEMQIAPMLSHKEVKISGKAATCSTSGKTEGTQCSVCTEILVPQETIEPLGHSYTGWTTKTPATCTAEGKQERTCQRCDMRETKKLSVLNHNYTAWTVTKEATCGKDGCKQRSCTSCKKTFTETIWATGDHSYTDWTVTKTATCAQSGTKQCKCLTCEETFTEAISATGNHNYTNGACSVCSKADPNAPTISLPTLPKVSTSAGYKITKVTTRISGTTVYVTLTAEKINYGNGYFVLFIHSSGFDYSNTINVKLNSNDIGSIVTQTFAIEYAISPEYKKYTLDIL